MNKHKIGKWNYDKDEGDWLVMDDGFSIIAIVQEESDVDPEKAARLIASAPELLEVLIRARRALAWASEQRPEFEAEYDLADHAIAKATGESA